jgi:hypothetical protein
LGHRDELQGSASLGYNSGWYKGISEVRRHLVDDYNARVAGKTGVSEMDTVTTPLPYVADDGKTARYQGYRIGYTAEGKPDSDDAEIYFDFGLIHADLVKQGEEWRIWHLVLQHDHTVEVGTDYSTVPVKLPFGADPLENRFGTPTQEETVYNPFFGWEYMWDDMPRPHETYSVKEGCSPESDLNKPYYKRIRR